MRIDNQELYHFHRNGIYTDLWQPGNEIIVNKLFESCYGKKTDRFTTGIRLNDGRVLNYDDFIDLCLEKDKDKETLIRLLKLAKEIINDTNIFKRELALEQVRCEHFSNLPSRRNSAWFTDELGLDYWRSIFETIKNKYTLYRVSLTGNIFKTSDYLIPNDLLPYEKYLEQAHLYWNPNFDNIKEDRNEYLFQGRVKVKERVE